MSGHRKWAEIKAKRVRKNGGGVIRNVLRRALCLRGLHFMRHAAVDENACTVSCQWCGWTWKLEGSLAGFTSLEAERCAAGKSSAEVLRRGLEKIRRA